VGVQGIKQPTADVFRRARCVEISHQIESLRDR
jgi:hypothetical protein